MSDILRPGDLSLDLGANVGVLTARMAELVSPGGKVISVEPNPKVAVQLKSTIESGFLDLVEVVVCGIAAGGPGKIGCHPGGFSELVEVIKTDDYEGEFHLMTIDHLVEKLSPYRIPDFIKIDIEGGEAELLDSMKGLFSGGVRPILLIEFHLEKCLKRNCNVEAVRGHLSGIGYIGRTVESAGTSYRLRDTLLFL